MKFGKILCGLLMAVSISVGLAANKGFKVFTASSLCKDLVSGQQFATCIHNALGQNQENFWVKAMHANGAAMQLLPGSTLIFGGGHHLDVKVYQYNWKTQKVGAFVCQVQVKSKQAKHPIQYNVFARSAGQGGYGCGQASS